MVAPSTLSANNSKRQTDLTANLMQTFETFFSKTTQQNSEIFYPKSPWVCQLNSKYGQNSNLS